MTLKDVKQESDRESLNKYTDEMESNEKHLTLIYDTVSEVIFLLAVEPDDRFRFISVNRAFLDVTGLSREQVVGKGIEQVLPETAHVLVISKYKEAISENKTILWEQFFAYRTGERVDAMTVTPVRNAEGVSTHLVGTVHELTKRKKAVEQIRFLSSVVRQSADGMAIANMEGNLLFVNDAWVSMHGYEKAEELLGQNLSVFHNEDQLKNDVEAFNRKVKEKGHNTGEVGHIRRDSTIFPTQMTTTLLRDENDNPIAIAGVATDITERKQAEEKLNASEDKYSSLVEKGKDGIIIIQDFVVKFVNSRMIEFTGFTKDEVIGKSFYNFVSSEYKELVAERVKKRLNSEAIPNKYEIDILSEDGSTIPVEINASRIEFEGRPADMAIIRDITERRQAEDKILKLNEELEQRVIERTAELEKRNEELEQMNKVFIGREVRMAELKEQIAELEKDIESGKKAGDKTT